MMKVIGFACALALAGALSYLYATFLFAFLFHVDLSQLDSLQLFIILTQLGRLGIALLLLRLGFKMSDLLSNLFMLEPYVCLGLMVLSLLGNLSLQAVELEILSTWMACVLCMLPPYAILSVSFNMIRNRGLVRVLLPAVAGFALLTFLVGVTSKTNGTISFGNFLDYLISLAKSDLLSGVSPLSSASSVPITSAVVYCSLLVYATLPATSGNVPPGVAFTFPLLSTLVASVWILNPLTSASGMLLSFTAPSLVIAASLWWFTRR